MNRIVTPAVLLATLVGTVEACPNPRVILARIYARGLGVPADPNKALGLLKGNQREDTQTLAKELSALAKNAPAKKP